MSEAKRWAHHVTWDGELKIQATMMALRSNGEYVLASDYDALAAECERLCATNNRLVDDGIKLADQRDAALAELAALKGGREPAANRKTWSPGVTGFSCLHCGTARAYHDMQTFCPTGPAFASGSSGAAPIATPAQASARVAVSERLPEGWSVSECSDMEADIYGFIVRSPKIDGVSACTSVWPTDTDPAHLLLWHVLAAAPTPGASDGKEEA